MPVCIILLLIMCQICYNAVMHNSILIMFLQYNVLSLYMRVTCLAMQHIVYIYTHMYYAIVFSCRLAHTQSHMFACGMCAVLFVLFCAVHTVVCYSHTCSTQCIHEEAHISTCVYDDDILQHMRRLPIMCCDFFSHQAIIAVGSLSCGHIHMYA